MLNASYNFGVTPIEMKEIVYQAVAYLGMGRVFPFLHAVNDFCIDHHIALPLTGQSTTNPIGNGCVAGEVAVEVPGTAVVDTLIHQIMRIKGVQRAYRVN